VPDLPPDLVRIAGYDILRNVAQGMLADVYEARHPVLRDLHVALKVLRPGHNVNHFMSACRLNARLDHPHIPKLREVGESAGRCHAATTFIEGDDLQNDIRGAFWKTEELSQFIADIASALDYAHGRGIVHGNVHPRHLLLGPNQSAWLIGFGEYWPAIPEIAGNPLHMAPEQLESGRLATPASDVYGLSETTFWLLCGRHPFVGFKYAELLAAKQKCQPGREIRKSRPDISPKVEEVLRRGLAAEPKDRYATCAEFATVFAEAGSINRDVPHSRQPLPHRPNFSN
jgi:serine/threonine protein kinase, bacterial